MTKRLLYSFAIILFITTVTVGIIAYSRGYRFNPKQKNLTVTGILSVSSFPDRASIWIEGKLTSATNASVTLSPGWYQIRISKEGYQTWEKKVRIQGEVVSQVDVLLIPANPSLRTLTVNGVFKPSLSPGGTKVAYIIPEETATSSATLPPKQGIWIYDLKEGPLGGKSIPKQIFQATKQWFNLYPWRNSKIFWSPDEKQLIMAFYKSDKKKEALLSALQFSTDNDKTLPLDVTLSYPTIINRWQSQQKEKEDLQIENLPPAVANLLSIATTNIRFSPDETKVLYLATASATLTQIINPPLIGSNPTSEVRTIEKGNFYIYDLKEDKNFPLRDKKTLPNLEIPIWYNDSKHILMIEKDTIYIVDYDGTNKRVVYGGPFEDFILYPWPAGGKLVILTNFNKPKTIPNLYEIDLR